ncbi:MAG: hypothetical protein KDK25_15680 [Leptospiraceae bacterium]|nr:hypothetical protein [Leptospiraceae bacterium]
MIAVSSIGFACLALALGMALYYRISLLRKYLIQPALIAGILLLLSGGQGFALIQQSNYQAWSHWPGFLISFLFSSLILAAPSGEDGRGKKAVFFQGGFVWILALGQIAFGLLVISFFEERWWLAGHIIEIGWMGGHGSAAALIAVADDLGHRDAAELALFSATIGLIYGSISGMILINWLRSRSAESEGIVSRERHVSDRRRGETEASDREGASSGTETRSAGESSNSIDENSSWLIAVIAAVLPVLLAYFLLAILEQAVSGNAEIRSWIGKLPLFFVALLLAFPVRKILEAVNLQDAAKARIINGLVLEFLIVSAVATLDLQLFLQSWQILLALTVAGAVWTALCFFALAPRLLSDHPDLSIINYGMSTGVTALGLLLLRSYRGFIPSRPATVYGLAAPFSAPFIGGGMISLLLPVWTLDAGPVTVGLSVAGVALVLLTILLWLRKGESESPGN